jgi:hypothetical protein
VRQFVLEHTRHAHLKNKRFFPVPKSHTLIGFIIVKTHLNIFNTSYVPIGRALPIIVLKLQVAGRERLDAALQLVRLDPGCLHFWSCSGKSFTPHFLKLIRNPLMVHFSM